MWYVSANIVSILWVQSCKPLISLGNRGAGMGHGGIHCTFYLHHDSGEVF